MSTRGPVTGITLMTVAMALFAVKDSFAKFIVQDTSPVQMIWMQQTTIFLVAAAISVSAYGVGALRPTPFGWQVLRGAAAVAGVGSLYWCLFYIPLADATAVASVAPAVVALLSPLILGERIGIRRVAAIVVGFAGVLVILRPGFGGQSVGYVIAFAAGSFMAVYYIANRRLAGLHAPLVTIAQNALIGMVLLAPVMPFIWHNPFDGNILHWSCFLLFSGVGQSLLVSAFLFAPAYAIAPYQYTNILFALVAGFVVFGTYPDLWVWTGIVLIVCSGVYIALREAALANPDVKAPPAS